VVAWTIEADHEVTLPLEASEATLVELPGQSKRISWPSNQLKLTLSGSPQYLLLGD